MPDARKTLQVLNDEWSSCTACELGARRLALKNPFVEGTGCTRSVMFIGEGPGRFEEQEGAPFIGPSGGLLRDTLKKFQFTDYYFTNLVTCRSCEPLIDLATGLPRMRKGYGGKPAEPMLKDSVPLPTQIAACRPRLLEEIYIVDPVLIVTLGGAAAEALLERHVTITKERGSTVHVNIPGFTERAVLTDKKKVWGHNVRGEYVRPTEQNMVRYLVLPTLHPAYVLRKVGDQGANSPIRQFGDDIRRAVKIYERYLVEALGIEPTSTSDADLSTLGGEHDDEELAEARP